MNTMVFNEFLSCEDKIVARNVRLEELRVLGGYLHGDWIQDRPKASVTCFKASPNELSFQLQARCCHWNMLALKGVRVIMRQVGCDVVARVDWAAYTTADRGIGYDLSLVVDNKATEDVEKGRVPVASSAVDAGYGVAELHFGKRTAKRIYVDGNCIVRHSPQYRSKALVYLLEGLKQKGYAPTVLFDANIFYVLKEKGDWFGLEQLDRMLKEGSDRTIVVPSGTPCDEYLLMLSDGDRAPIVTYDTFKQDHYRKRYPWLNNRVESGMRRVHSPLFMNGRVLIPTLRMNWRYTERGEVTIRAAANGKYLCADDCGNPANRPILANRETASDWERFTVIENMDGSVSFKAKANGRYLSAELNAGGCLNARADIVDGWEKFRLSWRGDCCVIRSCANGKFVSVMPETSQVVAQADESGILGAFTICSCD